MDKALREKGLKVIKLIRQMDITSAPLESDLAFASLEWAKEKENQFWSRCVVRCLLAYVECVLWNMRNTAPHLADIAGVALTQDELLTAGEKKLNKQGIEINAFLKFRDSAKETLRIFAKACGVTFTLPNNQGFDALCDTYDMRSRLMHPKTPFDPQVSAQDIAKAKRGIDWFTKEYGKMMERCQSEVRERFR